MENKLNKWFDAAKQANPIVSIQEVGAMINTAPQPVRVKPTFKTYMIMGISLTMLGGLTWLLSLEPITNHQTTSFVAQPVHQKRAEKPVLQKKHSDKIDLIHSDQQNVITEDKPIAIAAFIDSSSPDLAASAPIAEPQTSGLLDFGDRILYADKDVLKKLEIVIEEGRVNYYYKTYEHNKQVKATQLVGHQDKFYFIKGKPGKGYFIKPWESDFHPLYLTDSLGEHQQNFHFQDKPADQDDEGYKNRQRQKFLAAYDELVPVGIYSPLNHKLSILWYRPTKEFLNKLPKQYTKLYGKESYASSLKDPLPLAQGNDGMIRLTNEELAVLKIETDGYVLRYLTQTDTTATHFDFDSKYTRFFAFDIEINAMGDIRTSNMAKEDSTLHNRSSAVVPLIIGIEKKGAEEYDYMLKSKDVPQEYKYTYIDAIKEKLVPVVVETRPRFGFSDKNKKLIFWYGNNEAFRNVLPARFREQVKQQYPDLNETEHQKLISSLVERKKENDAKYILPQDKLDEIWNNRIILSKQELKKLGIDFNGKKLEYRQIGLKPDGGYSIIDLTITPGLYSLNTVNRASPILKRPVTELFAWYTTDTAVSYVRHNFIDHVENSKDYAVLLQQSGKTFVSRLDSMVPVYIGFDEKAVKRAKNKNPLKSQFFWFPVSPLLIDALPDKYKQMVKDKSTRIDLNKNK